MNRKNTAATDGLTEAVHGSYVCMGCVRYRVLNLLTIMQGENSIKPVGPPMDKIVNSI